MANSRKQILKMQLFQWWWNNSRNLAFHIFWVCPINNACFELKEREWTASIENATKIQPSPIYYPSNPDIVLMESCLMCSQRERLCELHKRNRTEFHNRNSTVNIRAKWSNITNCKFIYWFSRINKNGFIFYDESFYVRAM